MLAGVSAPQTPDSPPQRLRRKSICTTSANSPSAARNAEAYFSADGKKLIFQSTRDNVKCDHIFVMNIDGSDQRMISTARAAPRARTFIGW